MKLISIVLLSLVIAFVFAETTESKDLSSEERKHIIGVLERIFRKAKSPNNAKVPNSCQNGNSELQGHEVCCYGSSYSPPITQYAHCGFCCDDFFDPIFEWEEYDLCDQNCKDSFPTETNQTVNELLKGKLSK